MLYPAFFYELHIDAVITIPIINVTVIAITVSIVVMIEPAPVSRFLIIVMMPPAITMMIKIPHSI